MGSDWFYSLRFVSIDFEQQVVGSVGLRYARKISFSARQATKYTLESFVKT